MALTMCEKCGKEYSDTLDRCPHCKKKDSKIRIKKIILVLFCVVVIVLLISIMFLFVLPRVYYSKANAYFEEEKYKSAYKMYLNAGNYRDAESKAIISKDYMKLEEHYDSGIKLLEDKQFDEAITQFEMAGEYKNSSEQILLTEYEKAKDFESKEMYSEAADVYILCEGYQDSHEKVVGCAKKLEENGDYEAAIAVYNNLGPEYKNEKKYCEAQFAYSNKDYKSALTDFKDVKGLYDSGEMYIKSCYEYGCQLFVKMKYDEAEKYFDICGDYEEAKTKKSDCSFLYAEEKYKNGDLNKAKELFEKMDKDLTYKGVSVQDRLDTLSKYNSYLDLCGRWQTKGNNTYKVTEVSRDTGYSTWWNYEDDNPRSVEVRCIIKDDGSFVVKGKVDFYRLTSYSVLSEYIEGQEKNVEFSESFTSGIPKKIVIDDNTSITYDGSGFSLFFSETDDSESVYFRYIYESKFYYVDRVQKY